ncbi:GNAT family N-acetyltransferase [Aquiflexum sp. TKW24L]|uniref:GNAT family N-acetyltransferase n=1 Tax=Aquiflexum sp. TKW24L TaxID=2942212 RepID=UPI0020BF9563|nr:GNAT family N-acetyltransferase [Aquiflexum sp. TKW24L]MCL6260437.1 GNAT family N-acetyltransferase [Aquiflexum sp. TKW24L]
MNICKVLLPSQSRALALDQRFLMAWDELYSTCPWATVFQSRDFILTWFDCFFEFQPTILTDWDGKTMHGLWILTESKRGFSGPGLDLAEYQVWLSTPQVQQTFVKEALKVFSKIFPKKSIHLKYIPGSTSLEVFNRSSFFKPRTAWLDFQQPIMEVDKATLQNELKKKNRKEKINRLKRLGELQFSQITELEQFKSLIDEMTLQSDFRKGALYNKTFFYDEPHRKDFLLRLFELGLVHVTALSVNGTLIASNAGVMGRNVVHLQGINSHSPFYSKHSPGILHFLMFGIALSDANIPVFDLTPGGADGYKAVLANKNDEAYEFWYGPRAFIISKKISLRLKKWLKLKLQGKMLRNMDLSNFNVLIPQLKSDLTFWINRQFCFLKKERVNFLEKRTPVFEFSSKTDGINGGKLQIPNIEPKQFEISRNKLSDLFLWKQKDSKIPRMKLFQDCLVRIENGQEIYTLISEGYLIGICWWIPSSANKGNIDKTKDHSHFGFPSLTCSYYVGGKEELLMEWINWMLFNKLAQQDPLEKIFLEVTKEQKELSKIVLGSEYWKAIVI